MTMQTMSDLARARFDAFCANISELYGADAAYIGTPQARPFAVRGPSAAEHYAAGATPTPQQRLVERMQDTVEFLKLINMIGVEQLNGQTIGLLMDGPVASRVNPNANPPQRRVPVDSTGLDNFSYACVPTEFNPSFQYAKLDAWAKFPDFEIKMRDAILRRQALDRIQIGLNGTSQQPAAGMANNDPTLVGMNIGWPQWMLNNNAERVLSSGAVAGKLTYGASADYATVDAMLYEVRMELLPPWMRERDDLVWICGSDMIKDKMLPIANRGEGSLDMIAQFQLMTGKATLGYIPAYRVPSMPAGTALCTPLSNLSLYYQTGGMRRMLRDEPQWNRVVDYNSSNEAYVVEDPNAICMVQNVQPVTAVSDPAGLQEIADNTDAPQ